MQLETSTNQPPSFSMDLWRVYSFKKFIHYNLLSNFAGERLALLCRIRQIPGSSVALEVRFPNKRISWYSSVPRGKFCDNFVKYGMKTSFHILTIQRYVIYCHWKDVEWLALLLGIREVSCIVLGLEIGYSDRGLSLSYSVTSGKLIILSFDDIQTELLKASINFKALTDSYKA
jgi:hypothetical protein